MNRRDDLRGVQKRIREANQKLKDFRAAQGGTPETTVQMDKRVDLEAAIDELKLEEDVLRGLIKEENEARRNEIRSAVTPVPQGSAQHSRALVQGLWVLGLVTPHE